jgi:DNA polymerase III delta subunit
MLYLFCGDDTKEKLASYEAFLKTQAQASKETSEIFFINKNDFDPVQVESFYSGSSLFAESSIVVFHDILSEDKENEFILPRLKSMAESKNLFIFVEGKLAKPALDAFKKAKADLNIFEVPKEKKEKFNSFVIANAFAAKDKFNTWLYFRQAVDRGVALDELAGILFWKVKDMILKRNLGKWKEEELKTVAGLISYLLPEARKKGPEAESAMEQFLLEVF